MKNKKRWIIISIIGITVILALGACHPRATFKGHFGTDQERAEFRVDYVANRLIKTLDLDTSQQTRVWEMARECKSKIEIHQQHRDKTRAEILALATQEQVTADEITALVDAKIKQHRPMLDFMAQNLAEIHAMLTPAQRAKLVEEIKNHEHGSCRFHRFSKQS